MHELFPTSLAQPDFSVQDPPPWLVTAAQMRALEETAVVQGTSTLRLMENAGAAIAQVAQAQARPSGRFFVICGRGNNGGDGLVAVRMLAARGRRVFVELVDVTVPLSIEAQAQWEKLETPPSPILETPTSGDVIIDAIFGTGLNRAPQGAPAQAILKINAWRKRGAKVVSADLPSGVRSDSADAFEPSVQADVTVALGLAKWAHAIEPGASLCGRVLLADIGVAGPEEGARDTWPRLLVESALRAKLPPRSSNTHKGSFGHVLVVAGSAGKTGAAALCGQAALRSGVGLLTLACRPDALGWALNHAPEMMGQALLGEGPLGLADLPALLAAAEGKSAVVLGPGIPRGEQTGELLAEFLSRVSLPCVLDADALNAFSGQLGLLGKARAPMVLTPHPGEMARLLGRTSQQVQADRRGAIEALASVLPKATLVLKGARTLVMGGGVLRVNLTGNPGMATGGTGDVLSGILGALLAQNLAPDDAADVGVFVHGLAGDFAAAERGQAGLLAGDVIENLSAVWLRWGR